MILSFALLAVILGPGPDGGALPPALRVERGMRSTVSMTSAHGPLRALPTQGPRSDVLVLVSEPDASGAQRVEFVGQKPGKYNLARFVQHMDGTTAEDLAPLNVEITSRFPPGSEAGLARPELQTPSFGSRYSEFAPVGWGVWGAIGATLVVVRATRRRRRRPAPLPAPVSAPTERDELMTLLDRATAENLGAGTLARLEMLLVRALSRAESSGRAMESPGDLARALEMLRQKPVEGVALRAMEDWIHSGGVRDRFAASDAVRSARLALDHADAISASHARSGGGAE